MVVPLRGSVGFLYGCAVKGSDASKTSLCAAGPFEFFRVSEGRKSPERDWK